MPRYLVSFCNSAKSALAIISRQGIERLIDLDVYPSPQNGVIGTVGIAISDDSILVAIQHATPKIIRLDYDFNQHEQIDLGDVKDIHGLAFDGQSIVAVSTETNQIVKIGPGPKRPLSVMRQDNLALCDHDHINDVCIANGRTIYSMTGPRLPDQTRSGAVIDLDTGKVLISGLREPHSPFMWNGSIYVVESGTGNLLKCTEGFAPTRIFGVVGFPRGLFIDDDGIVLGRSGFRSISRGTIGDQRAAPHLDVPADANPLGRSAVYFLCHNSQEISVIDTSDIGLEIYQIVRLPEAADAVR